MDTVILLVIAIGLALYAVWQFVPSMRPVLPWSHPRSAVALRLAEPWPRPAAPLNPRLALALLPVWLLAALWETSPLYQHFGTAMPSGHDTTQYVWNLWWMKYALLNLHQYPFFTTYQFVPQEPNLAFHTFTPLNGLLSIPLQLLFGLPTAFDTLLLAGFVVGALGAFLLVRQETGSTAGALLGSVAIPFAPYLIAHLNGGHFAAVNNWAIPFFVLFLLRWLRAVTAPRAPTEKPVVWWRGPLRDAALAGLCLGCEGLNGLDQLTFAVSFGILAVLGSLGLHVWSCRDNLPALSERVRPWLAGVAMVSGISLVVFLPELVPYVIGLHDGWTTSTPLLASDDFSPDLTGYLTPLYLHPLWGKWATAVAAANHSLDQPKVVFLGYTTLFFALLSLFRARHPHIRHWWYMALLFWLLSLGPYLHAFGQGQFTIGTATFRLPLPYLLYHHIPLLGGGRIPGFASVITSLCLAVLAGHGISVVVERFRLPFAGVPLGVVAAGLVLFESLSAPIPLYTPQVDPFYTVLAHMPGHLATLETPLGWQDGRVKLGNIDRAQLYSATVSHKPGVTGYLGRVPDSFFQYYMNKPALAYFINPAVTPTHESQNPRLVLAMLRSMGVGYIIVHPFPYYTQMVAYVERMLGERYTYSDAQITAFIVPPAGSAEAIHP